MRTLLAMMALLLAGTVFAQQTQDLGELAKKEKARREELQKKGKKAKVYTTEDIDRVKDSVGILESSETQPAPTESMAPASESAESAPEEYVSTESLALDEEISRSLTREEQRREYEKQIDDLTVRRDELKRLIDEANEGSAGGTLASNPALLIQGYNEKQNQIIDLDNQIKDLQNQIKAMDQEDRNREQ